MKAVRISLFALALVACFGIQGAHASTVVVGTCKNGVQFTTIQDAVNHAPVGGTVDVCPGTYPEQVTISQGVKLVGIPATQAGVTSDAAVIVPPAGGVTANTSDIYGFPTAAQIFVNGATGVTISNITVDGSGNGLAGCATDLVGIYYKNSSGTITEDTARNQILDPADEGCQDGLAINVESNTGSPQVTISDNSVRNYDKNGITADGPAAGSPGPSVIVKGNTIVGIGATPAIAQNGIQIGYGATATIEGNYVADDIYTGPTYGSSGILIYDSANVSAKTNTVESTQYAIVTVSDTPGAADGAIVMSNHIGGTQNFDAIDLCSSNNQAKANVVYGSAQSGVHSDDTCSASGNNNTIQNNTINEACAGILEGSGSGNSFTPNKFFNVNYTLLAGDSCSPTPGSRGIHKSVRPSPYRQTAK